MSVFSIVKSVMDSNGWPQPVTAVSSSQDQNMRQSFALANKALTSVSFRKDWPVLMREHRFDTVEGQTNYDLPTDFHHIVQPSAVNSQQYQQLRGALTPIQWYRKVLNGSVDWANGYRIDMFGREFMVAPLPSSPEECIFMYITNQIAKDAAGTPVTRYSQDTDVSLVDEDLVEMDLTWRWRQKKGLDFTAEMAELNGTLMGRYAQFLSLGVLDVGRPHGYSTLTDGRLPPVFGV